MIKDAPKAFLSWSSGKDCAFALHEVRRLGLADVVGVLTTLNETYDRVAMHGVRNALLDRQVAALGLPVLKVMLPDKCSNGIYEERMEAACASLRAQGVGHVIFGDLLLEDVRRYREDRLAETGMRGLFPLWGRDTKRVAENVIAEGFAARLVCVDPRRLDASFAGRTFDAGLLADLPGDVDPCGENGEFHTVVTAGPVFAAPIPVSVGEIVEKEGFVFADIVPDD